MMGEISLSADNVISQLISFINQTSVYLWLRAHSCGHRNIDSSIATSIARDFSLSPLRKLRTGEWQPGRLHK